MVKIIYVLLATMISIRCVSQTYSASNILKKNILFYALTRGHSNYSQYFDANGYSNNGSVLYNCGWHDEIPDSSYSLELFEVDTINLSYPDSSVKLLSFTKPNLIFTNCSNSNRYNIYKYDYKIDFDDSYLIGLKRNGNEIIFISGHIFRDKIWNHFSYIGNNIHNIENFIKIKCYNLGIVSIYFKKNHLKNIISMLN